VRVLQSISRIINSKTKTTTKASKTLQYVRNLECALQASERALCIPVRRRFTTLILIVVVDVVVVLARPEQVCCSVWSCILIVTLLLLLLLI
jgi:hypothetical protein